MSFTTPALAEAIGIGISSPFTEPALVDLALELPYEAFIGEYEGRHGEVDHSGSYKKAVPPDLTWRVKTPIEYGSGSTFLGPLLASRVSDADFCSRTEGFHG